MDTHLHSAVAGSRSDTLLVFLPGAFLQPEEFEHQGFVKAVRDHGFATDVMLVDANVSYYYDQTFVQRLSDDVLAPARRDGYKSIWLVGISIGGFGALTHELQQPGLVEGLVVLAPYLGRRPLGAEIQKAGGLRVWRKPEGPPPDQEIDRKLWPFLQRYVDPETAAEMPPLFLGYGLADRFAPNHRLLADALPSGHVFTTEGGHDWPQWSQLWRDMLPCLPLPMLSPDAPRLPRLPNLPHLPTSTQVESVA